MSRVRVEVPWSFVKSRKWKRSRYWTAEDFAKVEALLPPRSRLLTTEAVAAGRVRGPIDIVGPDDEWLGWIMAGFLGFPDGRQPQIAGLEWVKDGDGGWWRLPLSRRTERESGDRHSEASMNVCPSCWMALPATGVCDYC